MFSYLCNNICNIEKWQRQQKMKIYFFAFFYLLRKCTFSHRKVLFSIHMRFSSNRRRLKNGFKTKIHTSPRIKNIKAGKRENIVICKIIIIQIICFSAVWYMIGDRLNYVGTQIDLLKR